MQQRPQSVLEPLASQSPRPRSPAYYRERACARQANRKKRARAKAKKAEAKAQAAVEAAKPARTGFGDAERKAAGLPTKVEQEGWKPQEWEKWKDQRKQHWLRVKMCVARVFGSGIAF